MVKRQERELFFKTVFMTQFLDEPEEAEEIISNFLELSELSDLKEGFLERINLLLTHLPEIDETINELAEGWKTSRIAKVDLALLRLALFEMKYEDLPKGVAINEVVELAKEYGEDRSYAFINGILGRV